MNSERISCPQGSKAAGETRNPIIGEKKTMSPKLMVFLSLKQSDTKCPTGIRPCTRYQARLTFSSILKTPLGAFTNRRLKDLPRQRRSRVLRRLRLISAIFALRGACSDGARG